MNSSINGTNKLRADELKKQLKLVVENSPEDICIRLHRAISWLRCAEKYSEDYDIKFITLWISFNSCYAEKEIDIESFTEKGHFRKFIYKLVQLDENQMFFNILWSKFSGPIRTLIENRYAYKYFWAAQRDPKINWEGGFNSAVRRGGQFLANQEVDKLLEIVLDRLYTVRNQLLHGGATYNSKLNRSQVKDASNILSFLMPVIIEIMIKNINDDWGNIKYPVIDN